MNWYRSGDRINNITFNSKLVTKYSMVLVTCC